MTQDKIDKVAGYVITGAVAVLTAMAATMQPVPHWVTYALAAAGALGGIFGVGIRARPGKAS